MVIFLFWISSALLFWAFFGYPLVMWIIARLFPKQHHIYRSLTPSVSIVLSVYNEEAVIGKKLDNFLQLSYPEDLLELIVVSDQSEDRTDAIVSALHHPRIKLLRQPERQGKTQALNRGVLEARGSILVFTDANAMFHPRAISNLVRHFSDPTIGLVSGKSVYFDPLTAKVARSGIYRRYEDFIKKSESSVASIVGADGAIYALRKELYEKLPSEYINDFIHTIQVVSIGCRAIIDEEAYCVEEEDNSTRTEFRRQTRIMAQSWRIFFSQIGPIIRKRRIFYAAELISHKLLRWLTLPFGTLLFCSAVASADEGTAYSAVAAFAILLSLGFLIAHIMPTDSFHAVHMFVILHAAALSGLMRYLRREKFATWAPRDR
jgi:cellulose synthase/poly-beta-1,6-N-acetylglucosamine synthase-like glycosyltransferase